MASSYIQQNVLCPFYNGDDGKLRITCEGLEDNTTTIQRFFRKYGTSSKPGWNDYVKLYCCGDWETCMWAETILKKYEEDGD